MVAVLSPTTQQQAIAADTFTGIGNNPSIPISLSGVVFYDANGNNKLDNLEWAIAGTVIELYKDQNTNAPYTTTTANNTGQYSFSNLTPGTYSVRNATNGEWLPAPGQISGLTSNQLVTKVLGGPIITSNSIDNIVLSGGDVASMFNFGAEYYPIQLLSKRMLLASSTPLLPVPEPSTATMLIFAAITLGIGAAGRRYLRKKTIAS